MNYDKLEKQANLIRYLQSIPEKLKRLYAMDSLDPQDNIELISEHHKLVKLRRDWQLDDIPALFAPPRYKNQVSESLVLYSRLFQWTEAKLMPAINEEIAAKLSDATIVRPLELQQCSPTYDMTIYTRLCPLYDRIKDDLDLDKLEIRKRLSQFWSYLDAPNKYEKVGL